VSRRISQAIIAIAEKIRNGEIADVEASIIGDDVQGYVTDAVNAMYRGDRNAAKRAIDANQREGGSSAQLQIPGMDHASLPSAIWSKSEDGQDIVLPRGQATLAQTKQEIRHARRSVTVRAAVVSGWEATVAALESLGVTDEWTNAEIDEKFGRQLGAGDDA